MVGSITETTVLKYLLKNPMTNSDQLVEVIMGKPLPVVDEELPFRNLSKYLNKEIQAVMAKDKIGNLHILTQYDVIQAV